MAYKDDPKGADLCGQLGKAGRGVQGIGVVIGIASVIVGIVLVLYKHESGGDFGTTTERPYVAGGLAFMAAGLVQALLLYLVGVWAQAWAHRNSPLRT